MDLGDAVSEQLEKAVKELTPFIERVHTEYNKFFAGAEKRPPLQLREQLDKQMDRLKGLMRQSQNHSINFRCQNVVGKYNTYKTLWEKKMQERETVKR